MYVCKDCWRDILQYNLFTKYVMAECNDYEEWHSGMYNEREKKKTKNKRNKNGFFRLTL